MWFALRVLFRKTVAVRAAFMSFDAPVFGTVDPWALLLSVVAGVALLHLKLGVVRTLAISSAASILLHLVLGVV